MAQAARQRWLPPDLKAEDNNEQNLVETIRSFATKIVWLALAPFRLAVSRPAFKLYLTSLFFLLASLTLLTVSSVAYSIFYYNYIPQISLDKVIHLQYGDEAHPYGIVDLPPRVLTTDQLYDVEVTLDLPRTPNNVEAGNFMLDLQLLGPPKSPFPSPDSASQRVLLNTIHSLTESSPIIAHSRRPAILPQPTHSLLASLDTLFLRLPWSIFTYPFTSGSTSISNSILTAESDIVKISMFESLVFGPSSTFTGATHSSSSPGQAEVPSNARFTVQTLKHVKTPLQVYSASIHFHARFTGLKHLVYNYRILSFLIFTTLFYLISLSTMATAYICISLLLFLRGSSSPSSSNQQSSTGPSKSVNKTKTEAADLTSTSETAAAKLLKSEPLEENTSALEDIPLAASQEPTTAQPGLLTPTSSHIKAEDDAFSDTDYEGVDPSLDPRAGPNGDKPNNFDSGLGTSIAGTSTTATAANTAPPPLPPSRHPGRDRSGTGTGTGTGRGNATDENVREWLAVTPAELERGRGRSSGRNSLVGGGGAAGNTNDGGAQEDGNGNGNGTLGRRRSRRFE